MGAESTELSFIAVQGLHPIYSVFTVVITHMRIVTYFSHSFMSLGQVLQVSSLHDVYVAYAGNAYVFGRDHVPPKSLAKVRIQMGELCNHLS